MTNEEFRNALTPNTTAYDPFFGVVPANTTQASGGKKTGWDYVTQGIGAITPLIVGLFGAPVQPDPNQYPGGYPYPTQPQPVQQASLGGSLLPLAAVGVGAYLLAKKT